MMNPFEQIPPNEIQFFKRKSFSIGFKLIDK